MLNQTATPTLRRCAPLAVGMMLFAFAILLRLFCLQGQAKHLAAAAGSGRYTLTVSGGAGVIYDAEFRPLTNAETTYRAVVNPTPEAVSRLLGHTASLEVMYEAVQAGTPFVCQVDSSEVAGADITVFEVPERYGTAPAAVHLIGYTNGEGNGVSGLEATYDALLRGVRRSSQVFYTVNGQGQLLGGIEKQVTRAEPVTAGVVTTIDADIQAICEEAAQFEKGAVLVAEVETGEIRAMVSCPTYDPEHVAEALAAENAPFLNRACCAYGVGSVFKIVTAASALRSGISPEFHSCCTGEIDISGQIFRCHKRDGHDWQNMTQAMTESCNTYFISLSRMIAPEILVGTATALGFGQETKLTKDLIGAAGTLPGQADLALPAERANFAFGQGKLTATPLQVLRMTCGVAADGHMPSLSLIRGITYDGETVAEPEPSQPGTQVLPRDIAETIQAMLTATVDGNPDSKARTDLVAAAGKTSTAQTGRFDENGTEYCHAWMTGFFPADAPRYAVTVLVEDGGSGNEAAAPVFRQIAEEMACRGLV